MLQKPLFDSNRPTLNMGYSGMPDVVFADFLTETDKFIQSHPHNLELMENVIAHNFVRIAQVKRERQQREEKEPDVA